MTPEDIERIRRSPVWRRDRMESLDTSDGRVLVKGQQPRRGNWGYAVLNGAAHLAKSPILKAIPLHGGAASQAVEVRRLTALYETGARVPQVLHVDEEFFVMEFFEGTNLAQVLAGNPPNALWMWETGLQRLLTTHSSGQYLSQAQARNFIVTRQGLVAIDFEDDPLEVMNLAEAQAHDWLVYLLSTAWLLPGKRADMLPVWRRFVPEGSPHAALLRTAARRLGWLRHLPQKRKPWGRDIISAQAAGAFLHEWASQR